MRGGRARRRLPAAILAAALAGCQAGYVLEQSCHQLRLRSRQVPLDSPELAETLSPESLERLRWVPRVLEFCREELALDPGDSYRTFLDTEGSPISYAVTAAHPLALIPYLWEFPFVGQVPYKGYFDEDDALEEAARIREDGFEAAVLPVGAFSTLGWFSDPVLSTMLEGDVTDLVDLLIHETTHRTVYFPGEASLNESLATHVAREGTVRFLYGHRELVGLLPGYLAQRRAHAEREGLLLRLRNDLDALYRSRASDGEKLARKGEIFATASAAWRDLAGEPEGREIIPSNASVLSIARYHEHVKIFARLQERRGGNPSDLVAYLKGLPSGEDPLPRILEEIEARAP